MRAILGVVFLCGPIYLTVQLMRTGSERLIGKMLTHGGYTGVFSTRRNWIRMLRSIYGLTLCTYAFGVSFILTGFSASLYIPLVVSAGIWAFSFVVWMSLFYLGVPKWMLCKSAQTMYRKEFGE